MSLSEKIARTWKPEPAKYPAGRQTINPRRMEPLTLPDGRKVEGRALYLGPIAKEGEPREPGGKPRTWEGDKWLVVLRMGGGEWDRLREQLPPTPARYVATTYRTGTGFRICPPKHQQYQSRVGAPEGFAAPADWVRCPVRLTLWEKAQVCPTAPAVSDVLTSLLTEGADATNYSDWRQWAEDTGMGRDSIKARKTFRAMERTALRLVAFLGGESPESFGELAAKIDDAEAERRTAARKAAEPAPKAEGGTP